MNEKINIAEMLKDCPKGMELDCVMYDGLEFDRVDERSNPNYSIVCRVKTESGQYNFHTFTKYGSYSRESYSKCVIFPKGKTTWEGFQGPFKDGDVVFYNDTIAIFKEWGDETLFKTYVTKYLCCDSLIDINVPLFGKSVRKEARFATEEEKQKLFDAIKANGYKWNPETKTLEKLIKPKFKVGDWVEFKYYERKPEKVIRIENNVYWLSSGATFMFQDESAWDLTTKKFDITTLKAFDKVLVRHSDTDYWRPAFWGKHITSQCSPFISSYGFTAQAIPFKGNEWLVGTTNDCDEYYKTWA